MKTTKVFKTFKVKSKNFRKYNTYNQLNVYALNTDIIMRVLKTTEGTNETFTITVKQFTKNIPILINDEYIINELCETLRTTPDNVKWLLNEGMAIFKSYTSCTNIDNICLVNGLHPNREEKQIMQQYKTV